MEASVINHHIRSFPDNEDTPTSENREAKISGVFFSTTLKPGRDASRIREASRCGLIQVI
jgi:hypothetical protein